jgi:hypothetical protein
MKKRTKTKRYYGGEDVRVDDDDLESQKVYRSDLTEVSDAERMPRSMAPVMRKAAKTESARNKAISAREDAPESKQKTVSTEEKREDTGAATGRMLVKKDRRSAEDKAAENKYIRENITAPLVTTALPAGRVAKGVYEVGKAANMARRMGSASKAYDAEKAAATGERTAKLAEIGNKSAEVKRSRDINRFHEDAFGGSQAARKYAEAGGMKRGGSVKRYSSGGSVSASRRGDGIASRGKTRGRII